MYVNSEMDKRDFLSHVNNQPRTSGMKLGQHKISCHVCQNQRSKNKQGSFACDRSPKNAS